MIMSYSTTVTSKYCDDIIVYPKTFQVCFTVVFSILVLVFIFLFPFELSSDTLVLEA